MNGLETSTIYMEGREIGGSPAPISVLETGGHTPSGGTDPRTLLTLDLLGWERWLGGMEVVVASLSHVCTGVAREVVCTAVQLPHPVPVPIPVPVPVPIPAAASPDCPVICIHGYHSKYGPVPTDANGPNEISGSHIPE